MEANCNARSGWAFDLGRSAVVYWLVFPPVTRKTRVQFPAAVILSNWKYGGGAPSVFVAAPSCYDLWFLGRMMRVLDFEMLIGCLTFEGELTDRFNWQQDIDN